MLDVLDYRTVPEALLASERLNGDRLVISEDGYRLTLREIVAQARLAAGGLVARSFAKGERAAIWASNCPEWILAGTAVHLAGGVIVPIGSRLQTKEAADILAQSAATVLFRGRSATSHAPLSRIEDQPLPHLATIVALHDDADGDPRSVAWRGLLDCGDKSASDEIERRIAQTQTDDICDMLFTSGTTGRPKGVPMRHGQCLIACEYSQRSFRFNSSDVLAGLFPFAHNAGYRAGWLMAVLLGFRIRPFDRYDPDSLLGALHDGVSVLPAVPTIYQELLDHPRRSGCRFPALRLAMTGGTSVPVSMIQRIQSELGAHAVTTAYGMTETAGNISFCAIGERPDIVASTAGKPLDNLDVRIVDAANTPVSQGSTGEIIVRGPQVMKGYWDRADTSEQHFTDDHFFRTGDVGRFDEEGNLGITGRIKDMYICGGFNCYPAEIEAALLQIPAVKAVAVIGVEDARLGQVGCAFVVRRDMPLKEDEVIGFARQHLANYKVPRIVRFVDSLPLTATGKVEKARLLPLL